MVPFHGKKETAEDLADYCQETDEADRVEGTTA